MGLLLARYCVKTLLYSFLSGFGVAPVGGLPPLLDADAGQVTVDLSHAGTQLIRVIDDGTGMTAAEIAASRQCAVPRRTTPRNERSVSPPFSQL